MTDGDASVESAILHLKEADPVIGSVIDAVGPFRLKPQRARFRSLVRAIIAQQISTSAARSITARLVEALKPGQLTAEGVAAMSFEELRCCGLSPQKAGYIHDLAAHVADGSVPLSRMGRWPDERIIECLTQVRGIGVWTAQMFLIFSMGRMDVFPPDDLGIRSAIRNLYGLPDLPNRATSLQIAEPWRPYSSVASWYCWRSIELSQGSPQP
ncbi:DNA-3-methyladenine glycosylase [Maioricimonas rarisocia]|uniref:DNA-3-methyladenine glycosylase II n=1 Tax=Maioricimonas rarisocia TaxID=2528026 RepID=A0A517ZEA5_9PLAN|nr:DNA-3-methyladenine glycosylase [Maioricimonas rarisocia]QDU40779.1 DNA-3-methyladenine glycosylase [Maioricimonas rarisocia]